MQVKIDQSTLTSRDAYWMDSKEKRAVIKMDDNLVLDKHGNSITCRYSSFFNTAFHYRSTREAIAVLKKHYQVKRKISEDRYWIIFDCEKK